MIPASVSEVKRIKFDDAVKSGLIRQFDPNPAYIKQLKNMVDLDPIRNAGLKVLVDPMWGNGAAWFKNLLAGGTTQIIEIHGERNPLFPEMARPEPIPPNVDAGLTKAKELKADVVVFTDGDADRCGFADENGQFIDQLRVYALLAMYLLDVRNQRGAIIKTLSTTSMLESLGKLYNVPVHETGVGFKYVAPLMMKHDAIIGGEESGGYAFRGHVPERDGIIASLFFLDFMVKTRKKPSELLAQLFAKVGPHFYDRIDFSIEASQRDEILRRIKAQSPKRIAGLDVVKINQTDGFKYILSDGSWLLIRFSGTEPLVRIYSEATDKARVAAIIADGKKLIEAKA
jgi:phosphomannomutase